METLTENNSPEMKTIVETYIIEEVEKLIYDNDELDKWNEHVKELGLEGQSQLSAPNKSPIPFMHMKESLRGVFKTLCPRHSDVKLFDKTPIPVEILDLVSLSFKEEYFSKIEIWYDDKDPDPVCVGLVLGWILHKKGTYEEVDGDHQFRTKEQAENYISENKLKSVEPYHYSTRDKRYLIGRWADVGRTFDQLKDLAVTRFVAEKTADLKQTIRDAQRQLEDIAADAEKQFAGVNNGLLPF